MRSVRRVALVALPLALVVAVVAYAFVDRRVAADPNAPVVVRDEPMPDLQGTTLAGGHLSTSEFAGKILVVNVWGTYCGPCERETPALVRVYDAYRGRGVAFLGIDHNELDLAGARTWWKAHDVPYPSLYDPQGRFAFDLDYIGLPSTYIVDREGTIRFQIPGETSRGQVSSLLDELLAGAEASPSAT
jgi:thiol-disulfide isomerase/thioredoxin